MADDVDIPEPRARFTLAGHEEAERAFDEAWRAGRLHHAWMLVGPRGVGKTTFAFRCARRVLGAKPDPAFGVLGAAPDDPVSRRVAAESHANLLTVGLGLNKTGTLRSEIVVDDARRIPKFFQSTAAEGGWRVCVVDPADAMNTSAANAILKTLEEPPAKALIILVVEAPGRLPTTIRSRCRVLSLRAPGVEAAAAIARELAGVPEKAAREAAAIAEGRPGDAVAIAAAGGAKLHAKLAALVDGLPRYDAGVAHALADELARKDAAPSRALFFRFLGAMAREKARQAATPRAAGAWGDAWSAVDARAREMDGLNLDAKLSVLMALADVRDAASEAAA